MIDKKSRKINLMFQKTLSNLRQLNSFKYFFKKKSIVKFPFWISFCQITFFDLLIYINKYFELLFMKHFLY